MGQRASAEPAVGLGRNATLAGYDDTGSATLRLSPEPVERVEGAADIKEVVLLEHEAAVIVELGEGLVSATDRDDGAACALLEHTAL